MDVLNNIIAFATNPWVSWVLTIVFAGAGLFYRKNLGKIKVVVFELLDVAKEHDRATDPKSEAGSMYSKKERAAMDKQIQELFAALAVLVGKK